MSGDKVQNYKMWIDGKWVDAASGKTYTVVNPATEEEIARIPLGDKDDVDRAVAAARKALPIWSRIPQIERSKIVNQIGVAIRERLEEFAQLDTLDRGVPIKAARFFHIPEAAQQFEFAAQVCRTLKGDVIDSIPGTLSYIRREPVGVCALITPWNSPLLMAANKLGFALATGNTCIVKPPTIDSLVTLKLAEILEKLDVPPGVVNIITGPGSTMGEALSSHPGVNLIAFTGSSETGKAIMASASRTVKHLMLELGGKNPVIVLEDADVDAAVEGCVFSSYSNSGQICASPGRYYVHEKLYDEFVEKFVAAAGKIVVGDPTSEKTQMGPVVSAEHRDRVEGYIKSGLEEGARLALGGKRPTEPPLNRGYFVMPTVFTNIGQNMKIAREEIFGPVACIMEKFSSEDKVIELANDNVYGLSASVWTKNTAKGIRVANEIHAGWVWVNEHLLIALGLPWGGWKDSGIGRDNSMHGIDEYTQLKVIYSDLSEEKHKPWHTL